MNATTCCHLQITRTDMVDKERNGLGNEEPVTLRIRPEIDGRTNHETTKAYQGAENGYPDALKQADEHGFAFLPNGGYGFADVVGFHLQEKARMAL